MWIKLIIVFLQATLIIDSEPIYHYPGNQFLPSTISGPSAQNRFESIGTLTHEIYLFPLWQTHLHKQGQRHWRASLVTD